jgi:purine-nucleoside phosphorylase
LLLTNAAGGIRDDLGPGSLMALTDHIDWTRPFAWRHSGPGGLGSPRPSPYSPHLRESLTRTAESLDMRLTEGVYAQMTGPCYETPAEIRALRSCGADAVGMSTGREAARGAALGMECVAVSCICNRAAGLSEALIHHEEVLAIGKRLREKLAGLIERFLGEME